MRRERIDVAAHAQLDRLASLLRDIVRSGGRDRWSHLFSHGHHFPTTISAVRSGYLDRPIAYVFEITESGKQYLDDIDAYQLRGQGP